MKSRPQAAGRWPAEHRSSNPLQPPRWPTRYTVVPKTVRSRRLGRYRTPVDARHPVTPTHPVGIVKTVTFAASPLALMSVTAWDCGWVALTSRRRLFTAIPLIVIPDTPVGADSDPETAARPLSSGAADWSIRRRFPVDLPPAAAEVDIAVVSLPEAAPPVGSTDHPPWLLNRPAAGWGLAMLKLRDHARRVVPCYVQPGAVVEAGTSRLLCN